MMAQKNGSIGILLPPLKYLVMINEMHKSYKDVQVLSFKLFLF